MQKGKFIIALIFTVIISGFIGAVFALHLAYVYQVPILINLLKGLSAGMLIGAITHIIFVYIQLNLRKRIWFSFLFTFIVIGIGTFIGAYLSGLRDLIPFIIIIITAEVIGLLITFILYRYNIWKIKK